MQCFFAANLLRSAQDTKRAAYIVMEILFAFI